MDGPTVEVHTAVDVDRPLCAPGAALGWDEPSVNMKLEGDLFALVTIARTKPLPGRD
jgi:hypothetical protein